MLKKVFSDKPSPLASVFEWHKRFSSDQEGDEDNERHARAVTLGSEGQIQEVDEDAYEYSDDS